jgi:hypothetical protein
MIKSDDPEVQAIFDLLTKRYGKAYMDAIHKNGLETSLADYLKYLCAAAAKGNKGEAAQWRRSIKRCRQSIAALQQELGVAAYKKLKYPPPEVEPQ